MNPQKTQVRLQKKIHSLMLIAFNAYLSLFLFYQRMPLVLTKAKFQKMIQIGKVSILPAPPSTPSTSKSFTLSRAEPDHIETIPSPLSFLPSSFPSTSHPAHLQPSVPALSPSTSILTSSQANWTATYTKRLIDVVLGKSSDSRHKSKQFWEEVATDLGVFSGTQCRNKYFNINKSRSKKKRENGATGSAPVVLDDCEKYLDEQLYSLKEPLEIPSEQLATCSSTLFSISEDVRSDSHSTTPQAAISTPYRKMPKKIHGSGSRQAVIRNTLQQQWVLFLKKSDERRQIRLQNEQKKITLREENLKVRQERNAIKKENLKLEKLKLEHKKLREKQKDDQMRKLLELEGERLKAVIELKAITEEKDIFKY